MVKAPANTGNDNNNSKEVTTMDQINNLKYSIFILDILKVVEIKLIEPSKEETPAMCKETIVISTEIPALKEDKGG